jgi:hypothetical protein
MTKARISQNPERHKSQHVALQRLPSLNACKHRARYKSIEQALRTARSKSFAFSGGDQLGPGPPGPEVWQSALQNRVYKTHVISAVCNMLARTYRPAGHGSEFLIDFVDTIRLRLHEGAVVRERMAEMKPMGESDVKFQRYARLYKSILVESIDSDVLLIACLYVQRCPEHSVYVRRFATRVADDADAPAQKGGKRARPEPKRREYEIIDVRAMLGLLHVAVRQAVGDEVVVPRHHVTNMIVLVTLLAGSDFSRKLPLVGARYLWEQLPALLPMLIMASNACSDEPEFRVDEELWLDLVLREVYRLKFEKHVRAITDDSTLDDVLEQIDSSSLSARTKQQIPTRAQAACTLQAFVLKSPYLAHIHAKHTHKTYTTHAQTPHRAVLCRTCCGSSRTGASRTALRRLTQAARTGSSCRTGACRLQPDARTVCNAPSNAR